MSTVAEQPQTSVYEAVIENPELEALLENREKRKASAKAVSKQYRDVDAAAKVALDQLDLGDGAPVRIGRFVVASKVTSGRSVSFETAPGRRITIKALEE
jgi:hypothetical protein